MLAGLWALVVRGALTVDLGMGRRIRPLGPLTLFIAAPRDVVFEIVSSPYLERTPRALATKLEVLERGEVPANTDKTVRRRELGRFIPTVQRDSG